MKNSTVEPIHTTLALAQRGGKTEELFPLVYKELRRLAAKKMLGEGKAITLQPTALVHEAYLRLMGEVDRDWESRAHFFAAAAIAMRRILIEKARARMGKKRGGHFQRVPLSADSLVQETNDVIDVLVLDEALTRLEAADPRKAQIVKLRYFAGLSSVETAQMMGISKATADRDWSFARAWLLRQIREKEKRGAIEGVEL